MTDLFGEEIKENEERLTRDFIKHTWNKLASEHGFSKVNLLTDARKKKYNSRIKMFGEAELWRIIQKELPQLSDFVHSGSWFGFDWLMHSDNNFAKFADGNYRKKDQPVDQGAFPDE